MGITTRKITKKDLHILDSAYWKAICEPFVHNYSWEEIVSLTDHVCAFMNYYHLLGIGDDLIAKYQDSKGFDLTSVFKEA